MAALFQLQSEHYAKCQSLNCPYTVSQVQLITVIHFCQSSTSMVNPLIYC